MGNWYCILYSSNHSCWYLCRRDSFGMGNLIDRKLMYEPIGDEV